MAFASATCLSNFGTFQSILPATDHHKTTFIPTPNFATPAKRSINGFLVGPLTADSPPPDLLFNSSPPTLVHDYDHHHHHHHHYRGNLGAAFDEYHHLKRHQYLNSELEEEEEDLNLYGGGGFLPPFPPSLIPGNLLDDESNYGVFPSSFPSLQLPITEPPLGGLPNIMPQEEVGDSMYKMIPPPLTTALYNTEHIRGEGNNGGHGSTDHRSECGGGKVVMLQSIAARERRRKIKQKTQELGKLIPGGTKLNTADMFLAASKYVEFLQAQLGILHFIAAHSIPHQGDEEMKKKKVEGEGQLTGEQVRLAGMLESPAVQEKLLARKKCLILKSSVNLLTTHHRHFFPSDPSITSDLIRLISPSDGPECPNLYFPAA